MHNGELQRGYVHKYANGHWSIKYVDEVPEQGGSRERVLGEEEVDLQTLNQRIERRCQDDFPGTTVTGSVFSSAVEQDTELQVLLAGCTDHWKLEFKDRKMPHWDARHWMSNMSSMVATPKHTDQ